MQGVSRSDRPDFPWLAGLVSAHGKARLALAVLMLLAVQAPGHSLTADEPGVEPGTITGGCVGELWLTLLFGYTEFDMGACFESLQSCDVDVDVELELELDSLDPEGLVETVESAAENVEGVVEIAEIAAESASAMGSGASSGMPISKLDLGPDNKVVDAPLAVELPSVFLRKNCSEQSAEDGVGAHSGSQTKTQVHQTPKTKVKVKY